jgi:acyl-CoA synthetase (AMP-forming)/AMP-acid ligase II
MHLAILRAKPDALKVPPEYLQIRLICNAAAGLPLSIATELRNVFGAVVLPSYGMTEYASIVPKNTLLTPG